MSGSLSDLPFSTTTLAGGIFSSPQTRRPLIVPVCAWPTSAVASKPPEGAVAAAVAGSGRAGHASAMIPITSGRV